MKPPQFDYARAHSVDEAVGLLQRPGAKVLAGGQSLVPLLNLRLARPALLVDIGRIPGLADCLVDSNNDLHLGALVRHQELLSNPVIGRNAPLLVEAARHIGHGAIRNRGTLGGSLCHADPAAELPTALLALGARFQLASVSGQRWVRADEFFLGPFTTAARDEEMMVEVVVPARPLDEGFAYAELSRRIGDFAIVGAAVLVQLRSGRISQAQIAWCGAGGKPLWAEALCRKLKGQPPDREAIVDGCNQAVADVGFTADIHGSAGFKRAALSAITSRALETAISRTTQGPDAAN